MKKCGHGKMSMKGMGGKGYGKPMSAKSGAKSSMKKTTARRK